VATAFADTTWPNADVTCLIQPAGTNPKAPTRRHQPEGTTITVYALAFLAPDINDATDTAVCLDRLGGGTRNQNNSSPAAKDLIFTKTGICIEVSVPTEVGFLSRWRVTDTYTTTTAAHLPKVLLYCMSSLCNGWTSAPFPTIGCILQCTPGTERHWVIVVCLDLLRPIQHLDRIDAHHRPLHVAQPVVR
jgi:hypothetical protein